MIALLSLFTVGIFILILLVDILPQFNTWQSRIKIGRYADQESWKQKVSEISKKWLFSTPTIKLTDNKRLIIIDIIKGNYKRNAIQYWQEASLLLGLIEEYKSTKSETTKVIINTYLDSKCNADGTWKIQPDQIDGVILAYAILSIPFIDANKYKASFDGMYNLVLSLKGDDGTIAYKSHVKQFRYVDTIGFICPFLTEYGLKFNHNEAIDLAVKQITEFNQYAMLNDTSIPCHTYHLQSKLPVGLFGWGRGLGWYAIGLIDAWKALPESDSRKSILQHYVIRFAKDAAQFQDNDGSWHWLISNSASQRDSSTVATLAWFYSNALSISEIATLCTETKEKALRYLMKVTQRNGAIDFSQGDTKGIAIHSQEFSILPFTQGFALRTLYRKDS
ncbi:glycoside hydrolase family 88 protein [Flavobacterium sp.]|uniref:glycoside hydrolase family 88 protein n=1 Tax=Flavobacterium sp. TaxID=239 RepID=UPI002B4B7FC4|nr:glycoside hydrolase family 88 protein [Flavobacterium sp.]HLP65540.1 glycoside hydrolase family 88 protein [Flavobacterium sp.]